MDEAGDAGLHSLDLPLMSNTNVVHVSHYVLDLTLNWEARTLTGSVILFCEPTAQVLQNGGPEQLENDRCSESSSGYNEKTSVINNAAGISIEQKLCINNCPNNQDHSTKDSAKRARHDHSYCMSTHPRLTASSESSLVNDHNSNDEELPSYGINCDGEKPTDIAFEMILDSWNLNVSSVHELSLLSSTNERSINSEEDWQHHYMSMNAKEAYNALQQSAKEPLEYMCEKNCIRIRKEKENTQKKIPRLIQIYYSTPCDGPSLKWTRDQDGSHCVYTHGHWINNRSLFPSQDAPAAMATWQAYIHAPIGLNVLMSGDDNEIVISPSLNTSLCKQQDSTDDKNDLCTYYYRASNVMPSSTLALAIGSWNKLSIDMSSRNSGTLPCRVFVPQAFIRQCHRLLVPYMSKCLQSASDVLGNHPFTRQDLLIVPSSFSSLGMASPNLIFLSQSILCGDGEMLLRVAHEVSHAWFGLSIGPRDWHEEWLSEGFATFAEGFIHARALQISDEQFQEEREIQDYLKLRTLTAELETVDKDLHLLRHGPSCQDDDANVEGTKYVINGMNPDKSFMQLHYLKGYFLLRHLERKCGTSMFLEFLRYYCMKYRSQLVDSKEFMITYKERFPSVAINVDELIHIWLDSADVKVSSNIQTLLMLERLLEVDKLHPNILQALEAINDLSGSNPDVLHKWCELVIKHNVESHLSDVTSFLIRHQAMGVYLFGELMLSKRGKMQTMARECFNKIKDDLEDGVFKTVHSMVFGY